MGGKQAAIVAGLLDQLLEMIGTAIESRMTGPRDAWFSMFLGYFVKHMPLSHGWFAREPPPTKSIIL